MLGLADLLFPSSCAGCRRLVRGGLCRDCIGAVPRLGPQTCGFCGAPVGFAVPECPDCRGRSHQFDAARQAVEFSSTVRKAIHNFKYRSERCLAGPLALLLLDLVDPEFDGHVTWIPAQADRRRQRGFDHGRSLAEAVGRELGIRAKATLRRTRTTPPQMGLEPEARRRNLIKAFSADATSGGIVVIDDVYTTGATATEAARALKASGASRVEVVCIARAVPGARS